ncbi:hypothetical protein [Flaviaesturariibacter amylovorans]|uniref:TonB-dependent receptor plug domain-containing protein n=1 Tax=Flaviaesturariibacter amylovorans TaxID=1084520 RepID=A0ABP8HHL3_9BACT
MKRLLSILFTLTLSTAAFAQRYTPTQRREDRLDEANNVRLFRAVDGTYFDFENDAATQSAVSYLNVLDWLQGRVAGLQLYRVRGVPVPFLRNQPASIFIDEIAMDPSVLNLIPVQDIALVKVMRSPVMVGARTLPGGAIAIYTKNGEEEEETPEAR